MNAGIAQPTPLPFLLLPESSSTIHRCEVEAKVYTGKVRVKRGDAIHDQEQEQRCPWQM